MNDLSELARQVISAEAALRSATRERDDTKRSADEAQRNYGIAKQNWLRAIQNIKKELTNEEVGTAGPSAEG